MSWELKNILSFQSYWHILHFWLHVIKQKHSSSGSFTNFCEGIFAEVFLPKIPYTMPVFLQIYFFHLVFLMYFILNFYEISLSFSSIFVSFNNKTFRFCFVCQKIYPRMFPYAKFNGYWLIVWILLMPRWKIKLSSCEKYSLFKVMNHDISNVA